ncbi:MAG: hypothetical protein P8R04_05225, partial [Gammaproteobacteria bacterium]|nr:hypothetical protein [Gammaproteobacteria bacterium]
MSSRQPFIRDYKNPAPATAEGSFKTLLATGKFRWLIAGVTLPLLVITVILSANHSEPTATATALTASDLSDPTTSNDTVTTINLPSAQNNTSQTTVETPNFAKNILPVQDTSEEGTLLLLRVKSGDSLDRLFRRNNLSIKDLHKITGLSLAK